MRTIFNILGPLTNPADAPNILMGVFHPDLVGIQVRALQRLGAEHAVVVYGRDGMDEVSLGAATMVGELQGRRDPRVRDPPRGLRLDDGEQPRAQGRDAGAVEGAAARRCSTTSPAPARDIVMLNAGVALYAANVARQHRRRRGAGARGDRLGQGAGQAGRSSSPSRASRGAEPVSDILQQDRRRQARGDRRGARGARPGVAAARGRGAAAGSATSSARCARKIAAGAAPR